MTATAQVIARNTCHCRQPIALLDGIGWCHTESSPFVHCDGAQPAKLVCPVCQRPRPVHDGLVDAHHAVGGSRCRGSLTPAAAPPQEPT